MGRRSRGRLYGQTYFRYTHGMLHSGTGLEAE